MTEEPFDTGKAIAAGLLASVAVATGFALGLITGSFIFL